MVPKGKNNNTPPLNKIMIIWTNDGLFYCLGVDALCYRQCDGGNCYRLFFAIDLL